MLKSTILAVLAGLGLFIAVGRSQGAAKDADGNADIQQAPLLPSTEPLRRLGDSEFRLPRRESYERMLQFSPDGKLLAACNWNEVRIWTFPDGKLMHDFSDAIDSDCITFSRDARELLVLDRRDKTIVRFDVKSGKQLRKNSLDVLRKNGATNYTFLDYGRWLCSTDNRGRLLVWDGNTGRLLLMKPSTSGGRPLVASDGVLTLSNGSGADRIDLRTGNRITRFTNYMKRIDPICTPDGSLMAGYSPDDKAIVFWKTDTNELVGGKIPAGEREWRSNQAVLSSDGKRLIHSTKHGKWEFDRKMAVFDVDTGNLVVEFPAPDVHFLEGPIISPDGKWVFPSGERSVFTPVSTDTGKPFREAPDHVLEVQSLSFTPNGSTLIVGSGDQRRAWDVATGRPGQVFESYHHIPYVAAADNCRAIIHGLRNGGARLQDIATGEIERSFDLGEFTHLAQFQIGADRKTFVGLVGSAYRRWDIATGDVIEEWKVPAQRRGWENQFGRYSFGGIVLGGNRLYRIDRVRKGGRLPDDSIDWGQFDLLLEDWTTQRVTNRLPIPYLDHFSVADVVDDRTLAVVTSDDWSSRASNRLEPGSTYLLIWDVATGWERLRVTRSRPDYFAAFSFAAITPDVRLAATGSQRTQIEIWNGFTGELIQKFNAPIDLTRLAFSDDGKVLASGHIDGSVYLWDTRAAWESAVPKAQLDQADLQKCWDDLAGDGSAPATALQRLLGDPAHAVEMLGSKLRPANSVPDIPTLIDSDDSEDEIRELGPQAIDALYDALAKSKSEETTARINRLINSATSPVLPPLRRRLLAIGLAERIGSESAVRVLETMAMGTDTAPETQAAADALRRFKGASR